MASKRPRKLKPSLRTGSKAARSSRTPVAAKRKPAVKKKPAAAKRSAAPKRTKKAAPALATATSAAQDITQTVGQDTSHAPPKPSRSTARSRRQLLVQAKAAAIPGRRRMTLAQLRAALVQLADQPSADAVSSDSGRRQSIAPAAPPPTTGLPWRYGVTELVAMPVDPLMVFVYWELSADAVDGVRARLGAGWDGAGQVLRAYDVAEAPESNDNGELVARARHHFDVDIGGEVGSHYLHLWSPQQTLIFEIGWRARSGRFAAAARSNRIATPRNAAEEDESEQWATVRNGGRP